MIEVKVHALVRPTERVEKVVQAVDRIFPGLTLDIRADRIQGYGGSESLQVFHNLLRDERILDTARSVMIIGRIGESFQFRISKVGAFMGRIAFPPDEEPLGSIHVQISGDTRIIDWLAPKTEDGRPVLEITLEELEGKAGIQDHAGIGDLTRISEPTGSIPSNDGRMDGVSENQQIAGVDA